MLKNNSYSLLCPIEVRFEKRVNMYFLASLVVLVVFSFEIEGQTYDKLRCGGTDPLNECFCETRLIDKNLEQCCAVENSCYVTENTTGDIEEDIIIPGSAHCTKGTILRKDEPCQGKCWGLGSKDVAVLCETPKHSNHKCSKSWPNNYLCRGSIQNICDR